MVIHRLSGHRCDQTEWEVVKEASILPCRDGIHLEIHRARLAVYHHVTECLFVVLIGQIMDDLEALANSKDRKVDTLLVLLPLHILPYLLRVLIEKGHLSSFHIDEWSGTASEKHAIDRV